MNLSQLFQRFHLSPQPKKTDRFCVPAHIAANKEYRDSAVLIPLIEIDNQIHLLFTQRPMHLKHHAGQICFPGGKVTNDDPNIIQTALRETQGVFSLINVTFYKKIYNLLKNIRLILE